MIFKKWIAAIAKFKAIDYYRKSTKTVEIISDEFHISTEKSAEDELIVMEDREELLKLINQLEPLDQKGVHYEIFTWYEDRGNR